MVAVGDARDKFPDYAFVDEARTLDFDGVRSVHVVGSLLLDTMCKRAESVDIGVEMAVRKKDRINFSYHDRRVLFLAALYDALVPFGSVTVEQFQRDQRKPVLVVRVSTTLVLRILPIFLSNKLRSVDLSTCYGQSMAEDGTFVAHLEWCHSRLQTCPPLRDAIVLAKLWLHHVNLSHVIGGFHVTMIMCYLQRKGGLVAQSVQIFKLFLEFVAALDPDTAVVHLMGDATASQAGAPSPSHCVKLMAGSVNIGWRIWTSHWLQLKSHAKAWLSNETLSVIRSSMATQGPPFAVQWDLLVEIPASSLSWMDQDYRGPVLAAAEDAASLLRRGFGERAECISFELPTAAESILFGIRLVADKAFKQLEAGPVANDTEACKGFRALWGSKTELRRFKDGTILEGVVWECRTTQERWAIPSRIVSHLLALHFSIQGARCIFDQLNGVLTGGDDEYLHLLGVFGELSQYLKSLKTLPLEINDVWSLDSALRGSSVAVADTTRPLGVLLQFANSSAWPDDLEAIRQLYRSFFLKMAQEIRIARCVVRSDCLDVHLKGYVFRLHIYLAKEVMLLKNKRIPVEPKHARAIHSSAVAGFQMKFNTFGHAVRLCKRWVSAHLLAGKFPEELLELTMIHVYAHFDPYPRPPINAMFAFFRWLRLVASFTWASEPLLVSINGDVLDRSSAFAVMSHSKIVPFVVTEFDGTSQWSRSLDVNMWKRMVLLARSALGLLLPDPLVVFGHNWNEYHLILHVRPNLKAPGEVGFAPVQRLVQELEGHFAHVARFFYDDATPSSNIGVVFLPRVLNGSVETMQCLAPSVTEEDKFSFNFAQFSRNLMTLGEGIIEKVVPQIRIQ